MPQVIQRALLSPAPLVYVVTLSWNKLEDTLVCLDSLNHLLYPNYRLLLVDNASADETVQTVRQRFPVVEVIRNSSNLGFAGGFNVGLRYAMKQGADCILIVNNDTFVEPNLLDELMAYAHLPDVGMLAPKIYYADEPQRICTVGGRCSWWTYEMYDAGDRQLDKGQWEMVIDRDYLAGCALLIRRSMLETIGLFDEGYWPAYYEDHDLCLRAKEAGYRLLMVPSARMWHKGAASSEGSDSPQHRYLMARQSVRFFSRHVHGWRRIIVVAYRFGSAIKTSARLLGRRKIASLQAYWRGLSDGIKAQRTP